ncbi:MAG: 5-(carboxyamino)imidazole ribonucleotide mutase [Chlamydiales bacterium]|nr:5-(carboxyamino)imidazole ribonucleotide mutase [Chlamydiia bacterium]MCP5507621.1 5-(carboxyamino)imidazole ribonucleotide mutase [Chlamydiales bacterium]
MGEKMDYLVSVIMGSQSDWNTMQETVRLLEALEITYEVRIVSAHRTPDRLYQFAKEAEDRGIQVIIAGAGGAAHLPGMVSAMTTLPVLGVPIQSKALSGLDSLLSIVQMPGGVPVGTLAIGTAGAKNAALLAASIIGLQHEQIAENLRAWRTKQSAGVAEEPEGVLA